MEAKKYRILNLTKKVTAVFGVALAALTSNTVNATTVNQDVVSDDNIIQFQAKTSKKPMPLMKLNLNNVEKSKFVASHMSHRSHSSHRSHMSHFSGYFR